MLYFAKAAAESLAQRLICTDKIRRKFNEIFFSLKSYINVKLDFVRNQRCTMESSTLFYLVKDIDDLQ